jgi:hypothetical protein
MLEQWSLRLTELTSTDTFLLTSFATVIYLPMGRLMSGGADPGYIGAATEAAAVA